MDFADPFIAYDMYPDLITRFEAIVGAHGDDVAIVAPARSPDDAVTSVTSVTYRQLDRRRRAIAHALSGRHHVGPGDRIGIGQAQQADTLAAMLGIATIGACYVPLDPELPADRLGYIRDDSGIRLALCAVERVDTLLIEDLLHPDDAGSADTAVGAHGAHPPKAPPPASGIVTPDTPLYIMYTSGSTGEPKGVVVPHGAVIRLVVDTRFMRLDRHTRFLQLAPQAFDAATLEIWGPLLNGGTCVLYTDTMVDPQTLRRVLRDGKVNAMWLTAALFNQFVTKWPDVFQGLSTLLFGGERASVPHVRRAFELLPDTALINGYGPTENTTFTCCHRVRGEDVEATAIDIPIGRAIEGTGIRIVDHALRDVGAGEAGELLAGGRGLAIGYLNRPELTAEKFIVDPGGKRWYRTGDLVRESDGVIHYLGRMDRQLKLDGHRIEPGEIEAAIMKLQPVSNAFVTCIETNADDRRLVAFLVGVFDKPSLRNALARELPRYMVPSMFVSVAELPLTPNGKVDVSALPDPCEASHAAAGSPDTADMRGAVAGIWREVVSGIDMRSYDDNFFDAGGTSMDMLRVKERLDACLQRDIPVVTLFRFPTVNKLALHLTDADEGGRAADGIDDRARQRRMQLSRRRERKAGTPPMNK